MMPLISLADGLAHARQHRYALGAFNVLDSHFLRALFAAAKQERSPFIINIAEVHFKYVSLDSLVETVKFEAARHDIPVVLNLDHGLHFEAVVRALRLGFSSVMFDGSTLSYEENIRQTREVVKMCHAVGVSVEAELGAVGGDEGGALYGHADEAFFTDPQLARGDVPPRITGVAQAFHVPGTIAGESETQIFLGTDSGNPVSLSILRRPGQSPRWGVAFGEIVDESAGQPARRTLGWYRLACGLPASLPRNAIDGLASADIATTVADYALVVRSVGACDRTPPAPPPAMTPRR